MPQDNLIRFQCAKCKRFNYWAHKNLRAVERKLEFKKHCRWCRAHTPHKQAKKT